MAKISYIEIVEMLSDRVQGPDKKKLEHIIARKKALKEEDDDLNEVLDGVLREIRGGEQDGI